jgi:hypothetical protein
MELAQKIAELHEVGLGFRRIAKELSNQGYRLNKDRCYRIFNTYAKESCIDKSEDKELSHLKLMETKGRRRFEVQREKEEVRRRLTTLYIESNVLTFEKRRRLFNDRVKLLRFAKRVMPVVDSMLWSDFSEFCEVRDYDLADAVAKSLGDQRDYELQSTYSSMKKFDAYLCEKISGYLACLREQERRRREETEVNDQESALGEREMEVVTIWLPDDFSCQ